MKHFASVLLVIAAVAVLGSNSLGQAPNNQAVAEREALQQQLREYNGRIENLESTLRDYKRLVADLSGEIRTLRGDLAKATSNREMIIMKENVEALRRQVEKVDEHRVNDSKRIEAALKDFAEVLKKRAAAPPADHGTASAGQRIPPPPISTPPQPADQPGFHYVVQPNDTLPRIVTKAKANGILVTKEQIMEANPTVKWERLQIGQKIFVPQPPPGK